MVRISDEFRQEQNRLKERQRKGGRKSLPQAELLSEGIYLRVPPGLHASLVLWAGFAGVSVQEYIRMKLGGQKPRLVPSINRDLWTRCSTIASNLNQLAHHANQQNLAGEAPDLRRLPHEIGQARELLSEVRAYLIGAASIPLEDDGCDTP